MAPGIAGIVALSACQPAGDAGTTGQAGVTTDTTVARQNAELAAEKDSLLASARSLFEAMNAIDSAASMAGYKGAKPGSEPMGKYEEQVQARVVKALERLRTVESRLKTSVARAERVGAQNSQLASELNSFRETATALQLQISNQQARVDTLTYLLALATNRGDSLEYQTKVLDYRIDSLSYEGGRVYVVSGSKDYLLDQGIVRETGGTRFPFIVKIGKTLQPAKLVPDSTVYAIYDRTTLTEIPLSTSKEYEVVSAQDLEGADLSNADGRTFRGTIKITDPTRFWAPSPYLILRER